MWHETENEQLIKQMWVKNAKNVRDKRQKTSWVIVNSTLIIDKQRMNLNDTITRVAWAVHGRQLSKHCSFHFLKKFSTFESFTIENIRHPTCGNHMMHSALFSALNNSLSKFMNRFVCVASCNEHLTIRQAQNQQIFNCAVWNVHSD